MTAARRRLQSRARTDFLTPSQGIEQLLADVRSVPGTVRQGALSAYDFIEEDPERAALLGALVSPDPYVGTLAGITEAFGYYPDPFNPDEYLPSVVGSLREGDVVGAGLTSLGALPIVGGLFGAAKAARLAKAAEMGEDPSALTVEGGPPDVSGGGGGSNLPPEPELDPGLSNLESRQKHDYRYGKFGGKNEERLPDTRAVVTTGVSRALAKMKLPEENMTGAQFKKFLFKQQGVSNLAYEQSGLKRLIENNLDNPNFVGRDKALDREYSKDDLLEVVKEKSPRIGLTKMQDEFDLQGLQEIDFDNRQVAMQGKQSERAFTLTTRYPDQPPDTQTVRHKHGGVASENAVMHARIRPGRFVLGPVQKDPSKTTLQQGLESVATNANTNPNAKRVDVVAEIQGDQAIDTLAERKTGIASLDPVKAATDAMTRYNNRVTNYTDTVLNTFNEATENAPRAREFFKEYIGPGSINEDGLGQETDLIAGTLQLARDIRRNVDRLDDGPVTPDKVRMALDDRFTGLDDLEIRDELYFGGLAGREVEQAAGGVQPTPLSGAGTITGQPNVSIDAVDYASRLITDDGVQALTELANNVGDTDPIRAAGTEVTGASVAVYNTRKAAAEPQILDRDAIDNFNTGVQGYRDKEVVLENLNENLADAQADRARLLLRSSEPFDQANQQVKETIALSRGRQSLEARQRFPTDPGSILKDLYVDNQSMEINLREAFPDLGDMDNGLGAAVEIFLEKKPMSMPSAKSQKTEVPRKNQGDQVNAALEFIASADPRVDDAVRASENPAQARVLVNQFRADLKAQLGLSETDIMVFSRATDRVDSTRVARDEAVKELDTLRAKLVSDLGSEEAFDASYRVSRNLRGRELYTDPTFSKYSEGISQTSQALLSQFVNERIVFDVLDELRIDSPPGEIDKLVGFEVGPSTRIKDGMLFPAGSIQAKAHGFRSDELINQYNKGQDTAIKAFTKNNPGLLKAGKVNLDAPRAEKDLDPNSFTQEELAEKSIEKRRAYNDPSFYVEITPEYRQKVTKVIDDLKGKQFSSREKFLEEFNRRMAEVSDNVKLNFAKGGAVKIHDGIGAMAREVL